MSLQFGLAKRAMRDNNAVTWAIDLGRGFAAGFWLHSKATRAR